MWKPRFQFGECRDKRAPAFLADASREMVTFLWV
jgi:hypothetical protein